MEFKRLKPKEYYCTVCDNWADYELSDNGHLRVFWASGPHDGEITLCEHCAKEILNKMKIVLDN